MSPILLPEIEHQSGFCDSRLALKNFETGGWWLMTAVTHVLFDSALSCSEDFVPNIDG